MSVHGGPSSMADDSVERRRLDDDESNGEVVVALFTTGGEKLNYGQLAVTPAMRLGGGAPGS
jgi:hypothetical protein